MKAPPSHTERSIERVEEEDSKKNAEKEHSRSGVDALDNPTESGLEGEAEGTVKA